jgi:AhpD family alkylhydroperoxidase
MSLPRIPPGTRDDIGLVNEAIVRLVGLGTGGGRPNIFATLARHRRLVRRGLGFAGALMPGGRLPRPDSELVILRVAHRCRCDYEWHHHERLGRLAGLSAEEIASARIGPDAPGYTPRQAAILRAVDELHDAREIGDDTWEDLRRLGLSDTDLIELCLLAGHYEMLAGTLNSLRVQPDTLPDGPPSPVLRIAQRVLERRQASTK